MKTTFGQIVKQLRRNKDISQRELAEKIGCDFTYISKIENDRMPAPSLETIEKMAGVLEVDKDVLLAQSGKLTEKVKDVISNPEAVKFLEQCSQMNLSDSEWQSLHNQLKSLR